MTTNCKKNHNEGLTEKRASYECKMDSLWYNLNNWSFCHQPVFIGHGTCNVVVQFWTCVCTRILKREQTLSLAPSQSCVSPQGFTKRFYKVNRLDSYLANLPDV